MPRTARLTRDDWAAAALDALAEGGPAAVAVEPVAARLRASKSSFYWLFANREALLSAALERWEQIQTDQILPRLTALTDPMERLSYLIRHALAATEGSALALMLHTETDDPAVRAVVERVTRRRLAVLEDGFVDLGHSAEAARNLAAASYAVYLGTAALRRVDAAPEDTTSYVETILSSLGAPDPSEAGSDSQQGFGDRRAGVQDEAAGAVGADQAGLA